MSAGGLNKHRGDTSATATAFLDWHWLGRKRVAAALTAALLTAILMFYSGIAVRADEQLRTFREGLLDRSASGDIHILEIDAKSIVAINSWPWPRSVHGAIVDKLAAAGADTIAFDVDFSSPSTPEEDGRFAEALERYEGTLILPTFIQKAGGNDAAVIENVPIDALRKNAFLASVNVRPEKDGAIRNFDYGIITENVVRPTMAAVLANARGDIGSNFRIDTSIDPATLPRHSVVDLLNGNIAPGALAGKSVFIGATAIELGDRYAMPRHGVQSGVVIQALAAETLIHRDDFGIWDQRIALYLALALAFWSASRRYLRSTLLAGSTGLVALNLIPLALEYLTIATIDIVPALSVLFSAMAICIVSDILGRFNHLRLVDIETGFPNERAMARALDNGQFRFVIVMQIENFSDVAAMLGENGRALALKNVADTLKLGTGDAQIFQLGTGTLAWLSSAENASALTEAIDGLRSVLASRIIVGNDRIIINAYFGIAPIPLGPSDKAINNACLAAHQAAITGTRWTIFNDDMSDRNGYVQYVLAGLEDAMAKNDIYLLYQPKWSLKEDRIIGVEALVRWNHAVLGPISPAEFIPTLEQNGQMARVTLHIANICGELARKWHDAGHDSSISLNISAPLFVDTDFTKAMMSTLTQLGKARNLIMFEITESAAVTNDTEIIASLDRFRKLGIRISIDDYGTGQSTLSYLQKFPADEIKIDQSFVRNLTDNRSDQILVRSTIELGHELGLKVIAEGVEDAATMNLLRQYGCDMIQGWHIARPMSESDVAKIIGSTADFNFDHQRSAA